MTSQNVHLAKIKEHLQVLKDAIVIGIEHRSTTIGFHTSACAMDLYSPTKVFRKLLWLRNTQQKVSSE